jgi:hypothetical protein
MTVLEQVLRGGKVGMLLRWHESGSVEVFGCRDAGLSTR